MNDWMMSVTIFKADGSVNYCCVTYGYVSSYEFYEGYVGPTEDFHSASTRIWYFEPED